MLYEFVSLQSDINTGGQGKKKLPYTLVLSPATCNVQELAISGQGVRKSVSHVSYTDPTA